MVVVGGKNIDLWACQFPEDHVPHVISLIVDSWQTFKVPDDRLEVPMTRQFVAHLRNHKDRSVCFFGIYWESWLLDDTGEVTGRVDIRFSQGWDERVYFSVECKRLRATSPGGRFSALAGEYVEDGMLRYFNGQYAVRLDKGGMLGYIMDGNVPQAIKDVAGAIASRKAKLYMKPSQDLRGSSLFPKAPNLKETRHTFGPGGRFCIHHIFLPVT